MARSVGEWLEGLGLERYADAFGENEIDLDAARLLTDDDLKEIGVALGARRKLLAAIPEIDSLAEATGDDRRPEGPAGAAAERRQLTVMFVDLAGSTELSQRFDPEDMRDILRAYQNAVSGEVARFEGHIAKFMGDGVFAYFGWPQAYEDQAERAVHAALGIIGAVRGLKLQDDIQLGVRVGIASGQVIVGDLLGEGSSEEAAVTGETPNLASRLQELATANQIVISDATRRLVGNAFDLIEMGGRQFKGFAAPVPVWKVVGEASAESRFEAVHGGDFLPIIGRTHEFGLLLDRWELAKTGTGQAVFVSGEAGIGKSRLLQSLREHLVDEPHFRVRCQASPYHSTTALYPMARQLEQTAEIAVDDDAATKRRKLEHVLAMSQDDATAHLQVVCSLLSIPLDDDDLIRDLTSEQLRERTIEVLMEQLVGLSRRRPALFVLEDAHWVDPSTEELIQRTLPRIAGEQVLMVITHRPEWQPEWAQDYENVLPLALTRLGPTQVAELVHSVAGDDVDEALIRRIAERTDGVPLFIEELTKAVLETRGEVSVDDVVIPETLQGLLLARLDRLDPAVREVAQIGAVVGREFTRELVGGLAPRNVDLDATLAELMRSRLVYQAGAGATRHYVFRHALIQEAAYNSLLLRRRREYHRDIAKALEEQSAAGTDVPAELLAQHYTTAGEAERGAHCWLTAGGRALARSANFEAIEHLQRGIALSEELPEGEARMRLQLDLQLNLGEAFIHAGRLADALDVFLKAARLARLISSPQDLARAATGFEDTEFYLARPEDASIVLLEEAIGKLSKEETIERCRALSALGRAYCTVGQLERARRVADEAVEMAHRVGDTRALYDSLIIDYYTIPLGQTERAQRSVEELNRLAREMGNWDPIMRAESWRLYSYILLGDREGFQASLNQYLAYSREHHAPLHVWVSTAGKAMDAIMDGDLARAEQAAEESLRLGQQLRMSDQALGVYGTQMFTIRREQGRLAEVAPVFKKFVDENPSDAAWRPGLALIAADLGFLEPARKVFDELAEDGFMLAEDAKRVATISYLAEVCARLEDRARAETLYEMLLPNRDYTVTIGITVVCYGATTRYLGMLAATLEDWDTAAEHFETAIEQNTEMRAWPWVAHSQADYARMLIARGDPKDAAKIQALRDSAWSAATQYDMMLLKGRIEGLSQAQA